LTAEACLRTRSHVSPALRGKDLDQVFGDRFVMRIHFETPHVEHEMGCRVVNSKNCTLSRMLAIGEGIDV
jgi:hypothetical protein